MASSHYASVPPPPPITQATGPRTAARENHPPSRGIASEAGALPRRVHHTHAALPNISTSLASSPGATLLINHPSQTPSSASTAPAWSGPYSPYASINHPLTATATTSQLPLSPMATRTAPALVAPYNPSDWGRSGPVSGSYVPYQATPPSAIRTTEITGMEAANMPSPPPPYSPSIDAPAQHIMSPVMSSGAFAPCAQPPSQTSFRDITSSLNPMSAHPLSAHPMSANPPSTLSSSGAVNPWDQHRTNASNYDTPRTGTPPAFPPPPGRNGRDRSGSRNRPEGRSLLSGLTALASRNRTGDQPQQPNAIDSLRFNTNEAISRAPVQLHHPTPQIPASPSNYMASPDTDVAFAPGARRAVSTGGIGTSGIGRRGPDQLDPGSALSGWRPGMPLPPPPSEPPPSGSRSQSMSRASEMSWSASSQRDITPAPASLTRRPHQRGTNLDPVPPTPAGWIDSQAQPTVQTTPSTGPLHVDTSVAGSGRVVVPSAQDEDASATSGNTSTGSQARRQPSTATPVIAGGLSRQPATRDRSARGIRERRSESRAAKDKAQEFSAGAFDDYDENDIQRSARPADLDLQSSLNRRRKPNVVAPTSGEGPSPSPFGEPGSAGHLKNKQAVGRNLAPGVHTTDTPPFSPVIDDAGHGNRRGSKASPVPPIALPTPPQRNNSDYFKNNSNLAPHSASGLSSAGDVIVESQTEDEIFTQACIERHRVFTEQEQAAKTDQERLELFADFIVKESRLRRDRYAMAFDAMAGTIFDLTRDLWRSYGSGRRSATPLATPATGADGYKLVKHTASSPADSQNNVSGIGEPPSFAPASPDSSPVQVRNREEAAQRGGGYKPCLSPIPSMAMSTVPDEQDSRGRSQSRWWEQSLDGASQGRGGRKVERSKRESKYMGINLEHMAQLENDLPPTPQTAGTTGGTPGPSSAAPPMYYGPDEYPPEKTGLHDMQPQVTPQYAFWNNSAAATPNTFKLDVSRLVTLPPPYPRHHPAVNNSHPDLTSVRATHRTLADLSDIAEIKATFGTKLDSLRGQHLQEAKARRDNMRSNINDQVHAGTMSYADAATVEKQFEVQEPRKMRDALQAEFDAFQADVMNPLHAMLSERITKSNAAIDHLRDAIEAARESHANSAQEEGDERPELLEKLTLLKWLFEAREVLHSEFFNTETSRNELYKVLVVNPYRAAGNEDKAADAERFFAEDENERRGAYEKESLKRAEALMATVEREVTGGVEDLLGAFWDIAPGLLATVQKIPEDLTPGPDAPELLIPPAELEENPVYDEHPLQYLFTLLTHAEKSARQFIESQTNLLCLLHEVKTSVMVGGSRVVESERVQAGGDEVAVGEEMREVRRLEEARLTSDLRDKINTVEGQWREGLGNTLDSCRTRVEEYLVETGGWDESLND